ncbi:26S proteasome non-ATPase regulatory subunit 5 [Habropoda laboriosa]|uniref:26S proteasome non-ATPase regulatory subunit 5 n=2 Tax=Habropoda laboriosa TaxID=597456 RepID=A0A0L7R562_9HYME|nr:26S proteasome non-ATPase regulatory subunit 5 [Habropoda laboriosa]
MTEWLQANIVRLGELNSVEEKKNILSDVKIKLGSLNNRESEQISRNVDLGQLFTQLNSNNREFVDQVCDILKTLFGIFKAGEVYQRYSTEISQLITHPSSAVKSLALNEILCIVSNPQKIFLLLTDVSLLVAIINRIGDDDLIVAKSAMSIMCIIGNDSKGLQILYKGELLQNFARLLVKNDTTSFRIYEVVVDVAKSSKEGLEASAQSGFLTSLINILDSEDVLLQVNALELLTQLALTEEGLRFLEQQGVLRSLVQKIEHEVPLLNLLIPGLMKFFGNVAHYWPHEIFSKYPVVVSELFKVIEFPENETILGVALDTLGHISMSVEGKYALQALGHEMQLILPIIAAVIQKMPPAVKIHGLNCLAQILDVQKVEQDNRILSLTKSWFDYLGDDPLGMIVAICTHQFADIRQAGLKVLEVLASQVWGQEYISTRLGFIEFLLHTNESFKECKEAKYEVIRRLTEAEPNIFPAYIMEKFTEFVSGRSHLQVTDVAVERL